jgi:hypothetical protein
LLELLAEGTYPEPLFPHRSVVAWATLTEVLPPGPALEDNPWDDPTQFRLIFKDIVAVNPLGVHVGRTLFPIPTQIGEALTPFDLLSTEE